jgi:hypothetical protein
MLFNFKVVHQNIYKMVITMWLRLSGKKLALWDNYPEAMGNAILVGEHVGEMFSYLSQENRNEFKKYSHHTTSLGSHVSLTSEGKLRNPVWER